MKPERVLKNIGTAHDWEGDLMSANDLSHLGPKKFEDAVKRYGKICELLLRTLYKELSMIVSPSQKQKMVSVEDKIGKGKRPIGDFGLGQLIALFSRSGLFAIARKISRSDVLDPTKLNEINSFRIDHTHYSESVIKSQVDEIRNYTTDILLQLKLISKDPEEIPEIREKTENQEARQQRIESLQRVLEKIRLGLVENRIVERDYEIDFGEGLYGHVEVKGEIIGACLGKDETFLILVRVLESTWPVDAEEDAYNTLSAEIQKVIENVAPETEKKLEILFFSESDGSSIEGSAYAYWNVKEGGIVFN